ncbi:NUG1_1 [Sanghuangporus sanghuang]
MGRNKHTKKDVPTKSKLKKDPGVPKLPDLKAKKNVERQKAAQRSMHPVRLDPDAPMASEPTLSSLAELAEQSEAASRLYTSAINDPSSSTAAADADQYKMQLRRQHIRTLHKVIEESDIIILVLDARDPEGCRSRLVEEEVRRREHEGKRLVFVLNKIDLVPRDNAEAWLRYLRHTTPTLPFKSSTQSQRSNLHSRTSPALLNLLKSYKAHHLPNSKGKGGSITVGVVGYPNVGKSSLINSLRRAKVCGVSAEAGFTKEMQAVQVERGIRVLDCPGVIFDDDDIDGAKESNVLLRNVLKVEDINDPIAVVDQILSKSPHSNLQKIYNLPPFSSSLEFLTMLALSSGRLHKGGTPDILASARQVIHDWNAHKIPFFSEPPAVHPSSLPSIVSGGVAVKYGLGEGGEAAVIAPGAEDVGDMQIVKDFAPAFDLGGLFSQADAGAFDYEMQDDEAQREDGIVEMESDDLAPKIPRKRSRSPSPLTLASPQHSPILSLSYPHSQNQEQDPTFSPPPPKRQRLTRSQTHLLRSQSQPQTQAPSNTPGLSSNNPLSRRTLKRDAKRARKAARRAHRRGPTSGGGGGMEIDDEGGHALEFTFMADVHNGVVQ